MTAIRDALAGDAAEVARVHVLSWKEAYRGVLPDEYLDALQVEDRLAWWIERLTADRDPRDHVLVAEDEDGHVCGFASAGSCQDDEGATAELRQIYLVPPVWGQGIGRALLAEVVERLRRDGYSEASLWVAPGNTRAQLLYTATGWEPERVEKTESVWGVKVVLTRYRRLLDA